MCFYTLKKALKMCFLVEVGWGRGKRGRRGRWPSPALALPKLSSPGGGGEFRLVQAAHVVHCTTFLLASPSGGRWAGRQPGSDEGRPRRQRLTFLMCLQAHAPLPGQAEGRPRRRRCELQNLNEKKPSLLTITFFLSFHEKTTIYLLTAML